MSKLEPANPLRSPSTLPFNLTAKPPYERRVEHSPYFLTHVFSA
nr:MAG TPA: hypothetical protein [Caudoviricetes sp.]